MRTLPFSDTHAMPALGLGTWLAKPGEVGAAVKEAIRVGYRHIDCAAVYGNEAEVGQALAESIQSGLVTRDELWVTSKLWNDRHDPVDVAPALDQTLRDLGLDYLDLYLVHWPVALRKGARPPWTTDNMIPIEQLPLADTWVAMEAARDAGKCRHIGVSNFSATKLEALAAGARVQPSCNQVELHPYLQQPELLQTCARLGVKVTGYSPLGAGARPKSMRQEQEPVLLEDPALAEIAGRLGVSSAQVALAWAQQRGTAVIPKSVRPERIAQNLASAELELSADDMAAVTALDRRRRYLDGSFWEIENGSYTRANLWDE